MFRHHSSTSHALGFLSFSHLPKTASPQMWTYPVCVSRLKKAPACWMSAQGSCRLAEANTFAPRPALSSNQPVRLTVGVISELERTGCRFTCHTETNMCFVLFSGPKLNSCWCKMVRIKKKLHFALKCTHHVWIERSFSPSLCLSGSSQAKHLFKINIWQPVKTLKGCLTPLIILKLNPPLTGWKVCFSIRHKPLTCHFKLRLNCPWRH